MPSLLSSQDLWEIHTLLARYGHLIDAKDWAGVANLFTPDGVVDFTEMGLPDLLTGRDSIEAFHDSIPQPAAHHCTNVEILSVEADGQECSVRSKWFVPDGATGVRGGDYYDLLRRSAEGWRFERRRGIRRFG